MKTLVFLSGKYSGDIEANIQTAREASIKLWEKGFVVFCPHLNTAHFDKDCKCTYEDYIEGDLLILKKCDMIVFLPGWEYSKGSQIEHEFALKNHILMQFYPYIYNQ